MFNESLSETSTWNNIRLTFSETKTVAYQRPVAFRTVGRLGGVGGDADHADGRRQAERRFQFGSGHRHDLALRFRRPAVVWEPTTDHHGHQTDQQRQHYINFRIACE